MSNSDATKFILANTPDPYAAAAAAERLGLHACSVVPRVFFPVEWVLKKGKRNAEVMAYVVSHCNSPEALAEIANRDSRVLVQKALDENRFFAGRRTRVQKLEAYVTRLEEHPAFRDNVTRGVSELLLSAVFEVGEGDVITALVDRCARVMARRGWCDDVVSYLRTWYSLGTEKDRQVWHHGSITPEKLFSLMSARSRSQSVMLLVGGLDETEEPCFDTEAARLFLANLKGNGLMVNGEARRLFSEAAVDLLVWRRAWHTVLDCQVLNTAQFARLLDASAAGELSYMALLLQGDRERLALLVGRMEALVQGGGLVRLRQPELSHMAACVDSGDELLDWIVLHASLYDQLGLLRGTWKGATGEIVPTVGQVRLVLTDRDIDVSSRKAIAFRLEACQKWEPWCEAVLDRIAGVAFEMKNDRRCGSYIYSRLEGAGVSLEIALEQFFLVGELVSLDDICDSLGALSRGLSFDNQGLWYQEGPSGAAAS